MQVEVLVGRDKGKHGIVKKIVYERNWVFVEGLNIVSVFTLYEQISSHLVTLNMLQMLIPCHTQYASNAHSVST